MQDINKIITYIGLLDSKYSVERNATKYLKLVEFIRKLRANDKHI